MAEGTHVELDHRRGWARVRAIGASLAGIVAIALSGASIVLVFVAGLARLWTWLRGADIDQTGVWGIAPEAAIVTAIVAVVLSVAIVFRWFWSGAIEIVLREVAAKPMAEGRSMATVRNVTEELSIGLGRDVPELFVTEDPTPNALSLRSSRRRVLCVTTATATLPRDECEALIAHELGHLWASDAHWVTSGMVGLARARRVGNFLTAAGVILFGISVSAAFSLSGFLWGTFLFGVLLTVVGTMSGSVLRRLELGMRRHADEIADVAAVRLARNPESLAALCARLAADDRTVRSAGWRSELLWFEMIEAADLADDVDPAAPLRTRRELIVRAQAAYAEARVPVPEPHRTDFASWLAEHPDDTPPAASQPSR